MTQKSISLQAWLLLLLLGGIWGASFLSNAVILREVGFASVVAFRVTGAAVILWVYVLLRRLALPRDPLIWASFVFAGVLNTALPFALITWGQTHIPSGLASILNCSTAIFGVLVAALVFADERLTRRKLAGVGNQFDENKSAEENEAAGEQLGSDLASRLMRRAMDICGVVLP